MKKIWLYMLVLCTALMSSASAFALVDLTAVGGINLDSLMSSAATSPTGNVGWTAGAMAGINFSKFQFEVGGFYNNTSNTLGATTTTGTWLDLTGELRLKLIPIVSFGVGGYYGIPTGTFTPAQTYNNDIGLSGDVMIRIPFVPFFGIVLDARYLFGLTDIDPSATTLNTRNFMGLAGLQFSL